MGKELYDDYVNSISKNISSLMEALSKCSDSRRCSEEKIRLKELIESIQTGQFSSKNEREVSGLFSCNKSLILMQELMKQCALVLFLIFIVKDYFLIGIISVFSITKNKMNS